jgi:cytochrome c oxidase accessory protein FixG
LGFVKQRLGTVKIIPIVAAGPDAGDDDTYVSLFEASKKVYPRSVSGRFAKLRWALVWLTQAVFYLTPWLAWGERQAVLFDLAARRFYIFGLVLYPQDFIYLAGLLIISALSLFLVTAIAGRVWCGYACPQTVYSEIFMWIERVIEGDRQKRMKLDAGASSAAKLGKKSLKHFAWLAVAMWTGYTFVGYFSPIRELGQDMLRLELGPWEMFWVGFYGLATYGNAGFLREQVCKYMCPYARFQGAMFDKDTLIVTYDEARGEPRGSRSKKIDHQAAGLGACVDCSLCVQVCPTDIDIRQGLQYECIGCAACVDVCDTVMDKMGYARGLIRYSTQNAMVKGWNTGEVWRRLRRARVLIYLAAWTLLCAGLLTSLALRTPYKVDVVRDRGTLARIVQGGQLENVYRLQLMNATEQAQRFQINVQGLTGLTVASGAEVEVGPAQSRWAVLRLHLPYGAVQSGSHPIQFQVRPLNTRYQLTEKSVFYVPR